MESTATLQEWETGNQALQQAYDAALIWLYFMQQKTLIFGRYNITLFGTGVRVLIDTRISLPGLRSKRGFIHNTHPWFFFSIVIFSNYIVGTLNRVVASKKLTIGAVRTSEYPILDTTGTSPLGALPEYERAITTW